MGDKHTHARIWKRIRHDPDQNQFQPPIKLISVLLNIYFGYKNVTCGLPPGLLPPRASAASFRLNVLGAGR